jgi:hypothetical protein
MRRKKQCNSIDANKPIDNIRKGMMWQTTTTLSTKRAIYCESSILFTSFIVLQLRGLVAVSFSRGLRRPLHHPDNRLLAPETSLETLFKSTHGIPVLSAVNHKEGTREVTKALITHTKRQNNDSHLDHLFQNNSIVNGTFNHQVLAVGYNETPSFSNGTASDSQYNNNHNPPDKGIALRPVQCARPQSIHSAFLVRLVGEPSLLTRYEKMRLEQVVVTSYNEWMETVCDGYHRIMENVELVAIDNVDWITQAHEETWLRDSFIASSSNPGEESSQARNMSASPSASPTSLSMEDPNQHYRPLYWLRASATCRNCPRNSLGNSNLLKAQDADTMRNNETNSDHHNGQSFDPSNRPVLSSASLILEEVCFCPVVAVVPRGISNGTQQVEASFTIDSLFPDHEAPTSIDLLFAVNGKIQQLRTEGIFLHVQRLDQLTEPDYAYYAQQMTDSNEVGGNIAVDDESDEESGSIQITSGVGNVTSSTIDETVNITNSSSPSENAFATPSSAPMPNSPSGETWTESTVVSNSTRRLSSALEYTTAALAIVFVLWII